MKLVIYNDNGQVIEQIGGIQKPLVHENNVEWEGGSLSGINLPFLLLDDGILVDEVTAEIMNLDKKNEHLKVDILKENEDLKARQDIMQQALDDLILGGML